jgi:hypothetical protein
MPPLILIVSSSGLCVLCLSICQQLFDHYQMLDDLTIYLRELMLFHTCTDLLVYVFRSLRVSIHRPHSVPDTSSTAKIDRKRTDCSVYHQRRLPASGYTQSLEITVDRTLTLPIPSFNFTFYPSKN